jgi:UDP-N-acetylglucosamine 1-carboxyvinyltransferase
MDRGYEHIEEKLRGVGAQIRRLGNVFNDKREHATVVA